MSEALKAAVERLGRLCADVEYERNETGPYEFEQDEMDEICAAIRLVRDALREAQENRDHYAAAADRLDALWLEEHAKVREKDEEIERLKGYMTPGQIEDSEHMKEIVPRMLKAETALAAERQRANDWMARVYNADCEALKEHERAEKAEAWLAMATDEMKAEREGTLDLRRRFGARDDETFPEFVERLATERERMKAEAEAEASEHESRANRWMVQAQHAEAELAAAIKQALEQHRIVQDQGWELRAANGRTERVEKALRSVLTHPDTTGRLQELVSEALRHTVPKPPGHDCPTCGTPGVLPAAPDPTPSEEARRLVEVQKKAWEALSEQPDLPLGHEFVAGHPHPAYQSYCALRGIFGLCGQPESAHRRKP